ncbi:MAG: helix-turn-helix transcriptional regulator [Aliishimia sp.]
MKPEDREAAARTGDTSAEACGVRLTMAMNAAELSQKELSAQVNKGHTSISNQQNGRQFPSRDVMMYFYKFHDIDFNFFYVGKFSHFPPELQERLFSNTSEK